MYEKFFLEIVDRFVEFLKIASLSIWISTLANDSLFKSVDKATRKESLEKSQRKNTILASWYLSEFVKKFLQFQCLKEANSNEHPSHTEN